jgi:hypothetical protein
VSVDERFGAQNGPRLCRNPLISCCSTRERLPRSFTFSNTGEYANIFHGNWLGCISVPLPAQYLRGIDLQKRDFERGLFSYLRGEWRQVGWWYYYLYALAVKVPIGFLCLTLWSIGLTFSRRITRSRLIDELMLWLPASAFLFFISSQTGFNHHLRYVLPMFPFAIIGMSKLATILHPSQYGKGIVMLSFLLWGIASSLSVYPHSLSYFNEFCGGPDEGHHQLSNSNIDWGQDLLYLKAWREEHPDTRPFYLAYFNIVGPNILDISCELPLISPTSDTTVNSLEELNRSGPRPGYYAVSANFVQGFPFPVTDGRGYSCGVPLNGVTVHGSNSMKSRGFCKAEGRFEPQNAHLRSRTP